MIHVFFCAIKISVVNKPWLLKFVDSLRNADLIIILIFARTSYFNTAL
jgi:hypothetical protein